MEDMEDEEKFWIYDPKVLFSKIVDFYPTKINNNFNAITRYFLISFIIFILFARYKWAYICFIGILLINVVGFVYTKYEDTEFKKFKIKDYLKCRRSTINNPMSNLLVLDKNSNMEACEDDKEEIIKNNLYWNFYENENDLSSKTRLRNFITMPITSIVNKREKFLDFLYDGNMSKCKYDGIECEKYRDIRYTK